jgi:hypothetical protein
VTFDYDRDVDRFVEERLGEGTLPSNDALKLAVLEHPLEAFEVGETYDKGELTDRLGESLDDPVLARRELANFGYVDHQHLDGTYTVRKRSLSEADVRSISRLERHAEDLGLLE